MKTIAMLLVSLLVIPVPSFAQVITGHRAHVNDVEIWRGFAEKLNPGTTLNVRLVNGERFKATLLQVSGDAMTVHPKTRVPVAPQLVRFADVRSLEVDNGKGASIAKAVAIGAATGAGAFFGLMALAVAFLDD